MRARTRHRRATAVLAAAAVGLATGLTTVSLAATSAIRISAGAVDAVNVTLDPVSSIAPGGSWGTLMTARVTVPQGTSPLLLVRYTARANCVSVVGAPVCSVRVRLEADGETPSTIGAATFAAAETSGASVVDTMEFVRSSVEPGTYVLRVEGRTTGTLVVNSFSQQVLVVEQLRSAEAPVRPPRPIVETRAVTADPFDASLVDPDWQTIVSTRVQVPAGQSNLLLARFSASSRCEDSPGPIEPAHQPCEAVIRFRRIVPGGFQQVAAYPERVRFDDTADETFEAQRMEAVAGPLPAGTYEILVRGNQAHFWRLRSPILVIDRINLVFGDGLEGQPWD